MKKQLKLMADYDCYPLWEYEKNNLVDNPSPDTFPLSNETITRLGKWAEDYDSTLNSEDPASSDFSSEEKEQEFEQEGINLWHKLTEELGKDYEIIYYSQELKKIITNPSELLTTKIAT